MTPSGQTICLCMIVKDEAPVIRRCLASVRPVLDTWVVVDTGSSDGTQEIVRAALRDLPGELVERPWVDFAHNRSEALTLARARADYALIIDADDALEVPPGFVLPDLEADAYVLDIRDTGVAYQRTQLVANALPWRYEGVLHEYLVCDRPTRSGHLPVAMRRNHDGARRRDPDTYRKDAVVLERALQAETNPFLLARYTFYLAQSYRDCAVHNRAIEAYLRRADMGHWDQEVFVSLYQAGKLMEHLGRDPEEVLAIYRRAGQACPSRIEAVHAASRLCRGLSRYREGYEIAKPALGRRAPADGLFVESWIYDYGLLDEYAVNAYWAQEYRGCAEACRTMLEQPSLPGADRERIEQNLNFATRKLADQLQAAAAPGSLSQWRPDRPLGGTEIMVEGLRQRLPDVFERIALRINGPDPIPPDDKPLVVWVHHDLDQSAMQWIRNAEAVARIRLFVFVSHWQRERYLNAFGLAPERCVVLRNATAFSHGLRHSTSSDVLSVAYTSTPFRGLSVLLDAWDLLKPAKARLHVWSSMQLYGPHVDDAGYTELVERARRMERVNYEGLLPNDALKQRLRTIDVLAYPSTFPETSCLAVIEALSAGCRVVCPARGALPETCFDFARLYSAPEDHRAHVVAFARELEAELARPWGGKPHLQWLQQVMCQAVYDWDRRVADWRDLMTDMAG